MTGECTAAGHSRVMLCERKPETIVGMTIADEAIREFMVIYRDEYDVALAEHDARVCAMRLLLFYELISKQLPSER